jgi:hypothetical protein
LIACRAFYACRSRSATDTYNASCTCCPGDANTSGSSASLDAGGAKHASGAYITLRTGGSSGAGRTRRAYGAGGTCVTLFGSEGGNGKFQKLNRDVVGGVLVLDDEEHTVICGKIQHCLDRTADGLVGCGG